MEHSPSEIREEPARTKREAMEVARSFISEQGYSRAALICIAVYHDGAAAEASKLADIFAEWQGAEDCERIWRRIAATVIELHHRAEESLGSGTAH